ncbi:MAG: methyl-accepting chemotaxis protein [Deltaproteobacteria bacterium]|nr:methyl-accepting chemotaxis protein [Deltaproteobacteria bacterium]
MSGQVREQLPGLRRRNRFILLMGLVVFPVFAVTDGLANPDLLSWIVAIRLGYASLAGLALVLLPRIGDRWLLALMFAACQVAGLASGAIMLVTGDLSAMVVLSVVPLIIAMHVPLGLRPAFAMHLGLLLSIWAVPTALRAGDYAHPTVVFAGVVAGVSAVVLAVLNHVIGARVHRGQDDALAELDRRNQELTGFLARERTRVASLAGALGEVSRVLASIDASAGELEGDAERLSGAAGQVDQGARQAIDGAEATQRLAAAMESALAGGRSQIEAHAQREVQEAAPARAGLAQGALTMAERVVEIGEAAQQVSEIAEEIGVLALNAGLAATRVGSASGLSVVSSETSKLSETVAAHAHALRQRVLEVLGAARRLALGVARHEEVSRDATLQSSEVLQGVQQVTLSIERIRTSTEALCRSSEEQASTAVAVNGSAQALAASAAGLRRTAAQLQERADQLWLDAARSS